MAKKKEKSVTKSNVRFEFQKWYGNENSVIESKIC